jgi:hypothetical protein
MMRIANNNIYITRGETATYTAKVIDKATGAPFILPKELGDGQMTSRFLIKFSVRKSEYVKDGTELTKYLWLSGFSGESSGTQYNIGKDLVLLDSTEVIDYPASDWGEHGEAFVVKNNVLYKRTTSLGTYEYAYYDGAKWNTYEFKISFPFLYGDTSDMASKSYKYAMTVYGGNNLIVTNEGLQGIDYKKPLVDAQFIVEADINE